MNSPPDLFKQKNSYNKQLNHAESSSENTTFPISILANDIEIAGNVGSLFRVADALGVKKLYLTGSTKTPPKYKIRKAARSTEKHIPYSYHESPAELLITLKQEGYIIIALEITPRSQNIREFKISKNEKICLLIGSENHGISNDLLAPVSYTHLTLPTIYSV